MAPMRGAAWARGLDRLLRHPVVYPRRDPTDAGPTAASAGRQRPGHDARGFRAVRPRADASRRCPPAGGLRGRAAFVLRPHLRAAHGRLGGRLAPDAGVHQGAHTTDRAGVNLGRIGVWLGPMAFLSTPDLRRAVTEIEEMGFGAIWIGEHLARDPFAAAAIMLEATRHITVATGIANIWVRDAVAMLNGALTLAEAWPNRFVLGIGVSHAPLLRARGHQ